jgi:hypothetical protein
MSNAVHSIGHRQEKKSLIRRPEPEYRFTAPSLNALRLLFVLLFRVRAKSDHEFEEVTLAVSELGRSIGLAYRMSREQAEMLLHELSSVVLTYRDEGRYVAAPFMAISALDHEAGVARLQLNSKLKPFFLGLRSFRRLHRSLLGLQSARAMLLYVYLRRFVGLKFQPRHRVALTDLFSTMHINRSETTWATFHKVYLQPAIEEITDKTETSVKYLPERCGRTDRKRGEVQAVIFEVAEREGAAEADKETGVLLIAPRKAPEVTT